MKTLGLLILIAFFLSGCGGSTEQTRVRVSDTYTPSSSTNTTSRSGTSSSSSESNESNTGDSANGNSLGTKGSQSSGIHD